MSKRQWSIPRLSPRLEPVVPRLARRPAQRQHAEACFLKQRMK